MQALYLICLAGALTLLPLAARAEAPASEAWPQSVTANIGDVTIRIDGALLRWTPGRIEYKGALMAVEGSVFSTVVSYPGAQHLGVSHYIDLPGHAGEVEKENISSVQFFLDDKLVQNASPTVQLKGKSFRLERRSTIRSFEVFSRVSVSDGVLLQWARIKTPKAAELQTLWAMAVPWNTTMTEFLFGRGNDALKDGRFNTSTTKPSEGLEKNVTWLAVYDPVGGKGGVTRVLQKPADADAWFQYTDAPVAYRKQRLMSFVGKTVPAGFDGTYCMVTGFFEASPTEWKSVAKRRATELAGVRVESVSSVDEHHEN
jgi:hypothetical protein